MLLKEVEKTFKTHQDVSLIRKELQINTECPPPRERDVKTTADTGITPGISTEKYSDQLLIKRRQAAIHTVLYVSESLCNHHLALSKPQTALSRCIMYSSIQ